MSYPAVREAYEAAGQSMATVHAALALLRAKRAPSPVKDGLNDGGSKV
jgi:hypothetical protein